MFKMTNQDDNDNYLRLSTKEENDPQLYFGVLKHLLCKIWRVHPFQRSVLGRMWVFGQVFKTPRKYPFMSNWLPKSVKWVRLCFIQAHQGSGTTSYFWKLSYFYEIWGWANTRGRGVMSLLVNLRMSRSSHPSTPLVPLYTPTHPPTHPVQMKMRTNEKSEELVNLRIRPSPPVSLVRSPPPEAPITGGRSRHSTVSLLLDVMYHFL